MLRHFARLVATSGALAVLACVQVTGPINVPVGIEAGATSSPAPSAIASSATTTPTATGAPATTAPTATAPPGSAPSTAPTRGPFEVRDIVDGDTIKVVDGGAVVTLRLIGVDTPETVHPSKPVECYGPEASAFLKKLLAGKTVTLAGDPTQGERDKYDRTLAYVWIGGGELVNEAIVAGGFGREYTYERPYAFQSRFRKAEQDARAAGKGLWGICPGAGVSATPTPSASAPDPMAPSTTTPASPGGVPNPGALAPEPGSVPSYGPTTVPTSAPTAPPTATPTQAPGEIQPGDCGPNMVYVKGYFRSDGTYVKAYCRRKPS